MDLAIAIAIIGTIALLVGLKLISKKEGVGHHHWKKGVRHPFETYLILILNIL